MQQRSDQKPAIVEEAPSIEDLVNFPPPIEQTSEEAATPRLAAGELLVGECIDARHPTLVGRVHVRWDSASGPRKWWLPVLHGLAVRVTDRVLIAQPSNWPEPLVTGVVDGFARRPELPLAEVARVTLERDEAVRIAAVDGTPLVEVSSSETGPIVRLLVADVDLELPGQLRIRANSIDLTAKQGEVKITASDDVTVQGEAINLN